MNTYAEEFAVLIERQFAIRNMVPAVQVAEEGLRAVADPSHGATGPLGGDHDENLFGVGVGFHAEPAADIVDQHADFLRIALEEGTGEPCPQQVAVLVRGVDGVALCVGVVAADGAAHLHRILDDPLVDEAHFRDMLCFIEGFVRRLGIADLRLEQEVLRHVVPELDRVVVHGPIGLDDRGQRHVVNLDGLGCVARLFQGFSDHKGHRVAHEPRPVGRQRILRGVDQRRPVWLCQGGKEWRRSGECTDSVIGEVLSRQYRKNARHTQGLRGVDGLDVGMGMGRAQHVGHRFAVARQVVVELAASGQKPGVFVSPDGLAYTVLRHDTSP